MIIEIRKYATGPVARLFLFGIAASFLINYIPALRKNNKIDPSSAMSVNNMQISRNDFEKEVVACTRYKEDLRKQFGEYVDTYMPNPRETAHEFLVRCSLLDQAGRALGVQLHEDYIAALLSGHDLSRVIAPEALSQSFAALLPYYKSLINGASSRDTHNGGRSGFSVVDFESNLDKSLVRNAVLDLAQSCTYIPQFDKREALKVQQNQKQFSVTSVPFDLILAAEKQKKIGDEDLSTFFVREQARGNYHEPALWSGKIWRLTAEKYGTVVSDSEISAYYDQNKESNYLKDPSKIEVKRTLVSHVSKESHEKAQALHKKLVADSRNFLEVSKQNTEGMAGIVSDTVAFDRNSKEIEQSIKVAAFLLKEPGDISDIIQTNRGYEIIQLAKRIPATFVSLASVRDKIRQTLVNNRLAADVGRELSIASNQSSEKPGDRLIAIATKHGVIPEEVKYRSSKDSTIAARMLRLSVGETDLLSENGVVIGMSLTNISPARKQSLAEVKELARQDLYAERATQVIAARLSEGLNPHAVVAWATQLGGKTEDTGWIDPANTTQLQDLGRKGLPLQEMLSLGKTGMFLTKLNGKDGSLIVLKNVKTPSSAGLDSEKSTNMAYLRQMRESQIKSGFVASLRRGAIIDTNDSVRDVA